MEIDKGVGKGMRLFLIDLITRIFRARNDWSEWKDIHNSTVINGKRFAVLISSGTKAQLQMKNDRYIWYRIG